MAANPGEAVLEQIRTSGRLHVVTWEDPLVDALGHDPRSFYVERFWLPVLGPSTTFLLRLLALALDVEPGGVHLDAVETARRLGLGERAGRNAPFTRTLGRCIDFEMARPAGRTTLAVRRRLPPLARRHLARLSDSLAAEHERWTAGERSPGPVAPAAACGRATPIPAEPPIALLRQRGRQLARSLLDLGEDVDAAEQQLLRWRYHPALARECVEWAAAAGRPAAQPGALLRGDSPGSLAPAARGQLDAVGT